MQEIVQEIEQIKNPKIVPNKGLELYKSLNMIQGGPAVQNDSDNLNLNESVQSAQTE